MKPLFILNRLLLCLLLPTIFSLSACAGAGPSYGEFVKEVSSWSGASAENCGVAEIGKENRDVVLECTRQAIAEGKPFFVIVQLQGIDSTVLQGLASRGRKDSVLYGFDSNITGGVSPDARSSIDRRPCAEPVVTTNSVPLVCRD